MGEGHLIDEPKGQPIACRCTLHDYATHDALQDAIDEINSQAGKLTGTLTVTGNVAHEVAKCTFLGFELERTFYDGSNVHDWTAFGRLHWIRRAPS